jgi:glyoxylase-like metal-dependent hydrolase (beta-lactamase superfamily II)
LTITIETICVGPLDVNCYLAGCAEHGACAVVDPGDSAQLILDAIGRLGWKVAHILNTHGHADHTGANAKLKQATGAPISIHRLDAPMLTGKDMKDMAAYMGLSPSPPPDALLEDGAGVAICDCITLKTLHTPGHTPGGVCFYHPGFLFSGDTLFHMSIGRSDLPGGNPETLLKSIRERLFTLPGGTAVYPGHGDPADIKFEKENNPFLVDPFSR